MLLPLSIVFSLFKFHLPIHLFLFSADDFVFSFIKNMAAFKQALLYFSRFPPSLCTASVPIHSISPLHNEWALLLLSKASLSICVLVPVPFFKAVASVIPFLYCIVCFSLLTESATVAAVFRSHWKNCLDPLSSFPQLIFSTWPLHLGTCPHTKLKPICQGHQWFYHCQNFNTVKISLDFP